MDNMIESTLRYIDEHLEDELTIKELALHANYSVYYFQRMFSLVTGYGLKEYIRERILTRAAFDLIYSSQKIIDISYKYGFMTPESFTKAFKQQHGLSLTVFRKSNSEFHATPPLLTNKKKERGVHMRVRIEKMDEVIVVGSKHIISLVDQQNQVIIPKLWDELNDSGMDDTLFSINDGSIQGVMGVCKKLSDDEIEYWIGTSVKEFKEGYDSLVLPKSDYVVFEVKGPLPQAIQEGWKEIMTHWIPTSGYEIDESFDLEVYSQEPPTDPNLITEIWMKLK